MADEDEFARERQRMVEEQLVRRGIKDQRVLEAMGSLPRELFVPPDVRHLAYADAPLPIGFRQTISQPYIVALMTELLELSESESVLEIGTGSGYQAAVLGRLARSTISLEVVPELASEASALLAQLGFNNVEVIHADGSLGMVARAPFDAIIVTAAAPKVPSPLRDQLADGGRMVLPVGGRDGQMLERWVRRGERTVRERLAPVAFVPLVGAFGWGPEEETRGWWF